MKQLIYSFTGHGTEFYIVAIQDRAFVGSTSPSSSSQCVELKPPSSSHAQSTASTTTTTTKRKNENENQEIKNEDDDNNNDDEKGVSSPQEIQAVAGCLLMDDGPVLYFAVARQSKQLGIYRVPMDTLSSPDTKIAMEPLTLHQAPKRVSSMLFGQIPASAAGTLPLTVLLTGDLAGDVFAYSLTKASTEITAKEAANESRLPHRRLLLGHTASMLSSVAFCQSQKNDNEGATTSQYILTADRDEKIRVTRFPSTFEIHGFLFGHTAFVSCMAVAGNHCFSCGGDSTLRVWDVEACREEACLDLQLLTKFSAPTGVPCEMCVAEISGSRAVAVIYDRCVHLDMFSVPTSDSNGNVEITERHQVILPGQPLGVTAFGSKLLVLVQEPHYILCYDWNGQVCPLPAASLQSCVDLAASTQARLPQAILERDNEDELKMSKNNETRGPASLMPWNNAERKQVASEKRKRRKKNKMNGKDDVSNDGLNGKGSVEE